MNVSQDLITKDTWNGHESVAPTVALRQMQTIKAVIVGDVGAGKTSLLMSAFGEDTQDMPFLPVCKTKHSPSGVRRMIRTCMQTIFDMQSLNLFVQGNPVSLALWDTAGAEDYGAFALHAAWNGRSRM
jgi:GTPase SAR1 family protein